MAQRTSAAIQKGGMLLVLAHYQLAGDFDLLDAAKVSPQIPARKHGRVTVHRSVFALQPVKQPVQISESEHRARTFDIARRERQHR